MILVIVVTILCLFMAYALFFLFSKKQTRICFVGPHATGKTQAMLSLLGIENKTVTTISNHRIIYKDIEIFELVPDDNVLDFTKKFHLDTENKFIFFVKNLEEIEAFPDCSLFNITFVLWKKTDIKKRKDVVYLEESRENLRDLIIKLR